MGIVEVISPGLFTAVQDAGRVGYGHFGIPKSGALDRRSMQRANGLLGNPPNTPVLEITFIGPQLKFLQDATIVISGAEVDIMVDDQLFNIDEVIPIPKNALVKIGKIKNGVRSYLALSGGFKTELLMGSHSWSRQLTNPFRLSKGMTLSFNQVKLKSSSNIPDATPLNSNEFNVLPGPEFHWLSKDQQQQLFDQEYTLLPSSDRMAYSFSSEPILPFTSQDFLTGPVLPGVVQWYPNGQLVLLHRDAQRTGGYPRVLIFEEDDLDAIAQVGIARPFGIRLKFFSPIFPATIST